MKPYQQSRIFWLSIAVAGISASLAVVQSAPAVPDWLKTVAAAAVAGCGAVAAILRVEDSRGAK
jgi:hypothetical protein